MKTVLKYPGAKNRIADWIISYMPEHDVYLEPFGGSMAVLLNKPRSHIETINDIDADVVNFFRILRESTEELQTAISYTPYARQEYINAYESDEIDDFERARRFCVKCWMGFGESQLYQNGFKSGQQSKSPNPAKAWDELPETIALVAKRLKGVQIESLPALELLLRYNTKDVFIYADPPYLPTIRKKYLYQHEMDENSHIEFLDAILLHPGPVMLSGYDNELYNNKLKGWDKAYKSTVAESGNKRVETIWMNYSVNKQMSFIF